MNRILAFAVVFSVCLIPAMSGGVIRVYQKPKPVVNDNNTEISIKRVPEGDELVLTLNKGQDVSWFQIQWFKDGQPLLDETSQELHRPMATADNNGVYTVQMSSPCASVMSRPIEVIVEPRSFQLNTQLPQGDEGATGLNETTTSNFELRECQPNPVSDKATITFVTHISSPVTLKVVDLNGNVVATLVNDILPAGTHDVTINTAEHQMSSSLYYYVLTAPGFTDTKPLMIVK